MKIIAHRGASGYAPENTRIAIMKALEMNTDGFEVDLQQTIDGEIVVFHDWSLERTTTGSGYLKMKTLKELKSLDSGKWFGNGQFSEQILTLKELLEIVPKDKILNLEVKVLLGERQGIEEKVIEILKKSGRIDENIIISSFNHEILKTINRLEPQIKVGLLVVAGLLNIDEYIKSNDLKLFSVHSDGEFITPKFIKKVKELGLKNYVWTVNRIEEGEVLNSLGVDGIMTNYLDRFKK
jgi:glycerophosphoryl diester phosphodiesterase